MTSTFDNELRLNEQQTGDNSGSWGTVTNLNLTLIGEALGFGEQQVFPQDQNAETQIADGASDPARAMYFKVTSAGNLTATRQMTILPNTTSRLMFIENATSGSQSILVKCGSDNAGDKVTIPTGLTKAVYLTGAGGSGAVVDAFAALSVDDLLVDDDLTVIDDVDIGGALTMSGGGDGAVSFSTASSIKILDNNAASLVFEEANAAYMTFVTTNSSEAVKFDVGVNMAETALVTGVLTTTAGTVFNGGFASNAGSSITRNDNGAQLTLISTDTDELSGPVLDLYRNSGNAIDGDNIGQINFYGENTSDQKHQYLYLFSEILDATAGTEDVRFVIGGLVAGADSSLFEYTSTAGSGDDPELVFNKTSRNINFRVKSSGNANALFVDGGNSRIGIGIATPSTPLEVNGIATMDSARLSSNSGTSYWDIRRDSSTGHFVIKDDGLGDVLTIRQDTGNIAVTGIIATNTLGTDNVRLGENAGEAIVSGGDRNIVIGKNAGQKITGGDSNVAIGWEALKKETARSNNIAIGASALTDQESDQDAYNVAVGYHAGKIVSTGVFNTLVGSLCYDNLTLGDLHTAIGYNLGPSAVDVSSEIIIGSNVNGAGTNQVRIGLASGSATLSLDGNDTSWSASSDSRLKTDVATCAVGLDFIKALRPITYKWEAKNAVANTLPQYDADSSDPVYGSGKIQHGFLAQEVKTAIDAHSGLKNGFTMWREDPDGTQQVAPTALVPMLVKAIQELEARIAVLEG